MDWNVVWQTIGGIIATIGAIIIALLQLRGVRPFGKSRSALKTDIEILKMLDKPDPNYHSIKKYIDETIATI